MPSASSCQPPSTISSMIGRAGQILDQVGAGERRGELQIGRQADRGVPAMRDEAHAVLLRHPGDPPLLADAADLGHVGLHDVEGAALQPGLEGLAARQHLAAGDRHAALRAQRARNRRSASGCSASSNQATS